MNPGVPQTLILAWGNQGRIDDGLGPGLAQAVSAMKIEQLHIVSEYQLQVEHAWDIRGFDRVIFVDASRTGSAPFTFESLGAERGVPRYTSHELSPGAVLALANDLYEARPEAWLMGIRGYEFDEFGEWLSAEAEANLHQATAFLRKMLEQDLYPEVTPAEPTQQVNTKQGSQTAR